MILGGIVYQPIHILISLLHNTHPPQQNDTPPEN